MLIFAFLALFDSPSNCMYPVGPFDLAHSADGFDQQHPRSLVCDAADGFVPAEEKLDTPVDKKAAVLVEERPPQLESTPLQEQKVKVELSQVAAPRAPLKSTKESLVDDFLDYLNAEIAPHTPGYALAIMLEGEVVLLKGSGEKRQGSGEPIDTHTVFRLASVSKTFASAAVGKMVEQESIRWDEKMSHFVKDLSFSNEDYASELTVQHILSHTTGLLPHAYTNLIEEPLAFNKITSKLHQVPFVCEPGDCYGYQNVAYSLVSEIFPLLRQQSFEEYVSSELLRPLNMSDAHYGYRAYMDDDNRVTPHVWSRRRQAWVPVNVRDNYYKVAPAAGLNASISDMAQWLRAQTGQFPQVLSADTLDAMHSKVVRTSRRQAHYRGQRWRGLQKAYYGLGWRVFDYRDHQGFVHHGGFVQGHRASVLFHREKQMGFAFLANSEAKVANEVVPAFLSRYLDAYPERGRQEVAQVAKNAKVEALAPRAMPPGLASPQELSLNK